MSESPDHVLPKSFYSRDAHELARALLGQHLVSAVGGSTVVGRIVEVEVYGGVDDPACHADRGTPTRRTASMFGEPGRAYVYRIYGMYDCFNIVAPRGARDKASAILVRAVEPLDGLELMARRRGTDRVRNLTSGPGKLCQAFGLCRELDGHALNRHPLFLSAADPVPDSAIHSTPRIGLNEKTCGDATHFEWRYVERDNEFLSR